MTEDEENSLLKQAELIKQRRTTTLAQAKANEARVQAQLQAEAEEQERKDSYSRYVDHYNNLLKDGRYSQEERDPEYTYDLPEWEGIVLDKYEYDDYYRRQMPKYTYFDPAYDNWQDILDYIGAHQRIKISIELLPPLPYDDWKKLTIKEQEDRERRY